MSCGSEVAEGSQPNSEPRRFQTAYLDQQTQPETTASLQGSLDAPLALIVAVSTYYALLSMVYSSPATANAVGEP